MQEVAAREVKRCKRRRKITPQGVFRGTLQHDVVEVGKARRHVEQTLSPIQIGKTVNIFVEEEKGILLVEVERSS